mmetsp:Transcript_11452/g.27348  ORF Transcript_11452/g.27348 Transcript_11452/m.27348 type:complete len:932 (+) Transcript_11452:401-3196(+)
MQSIDEMSPSSQPPLPSRPAGPLSSSTSSPPPQQQQMALHRTDSSDSLHQELEPPDFNHLRNLLAVLMLTTFLSLCSALDAKTQCLHPETSLAYGGEGEGGDGDIDDGYGYGYSYGNEDWGQYYNYYSVEGNDGDGDVDQDADNGYYHPSQDDLDEMMGECVFLFRRVMVPVSVTVIACAIVSLLLINRHWDNIGNSAEHVVPSHLAALLQLSLPFLIMGLSWMYAIAFLMFKIKFEDNSDHDDNDDNNNNDDVDNNNGQFFRNPFKSLGAVDKMGRVGINANLYYMSHFSTMIVMILMYNNIVDVCRWWKMGIQPQSSESGAIRPTPSFHEQVHAMLSTTSVAKLASFYRRRRKTWYQFLLRLRERSGYWVAAFFFSLLVFASSGYVYIQVLVNLAYKMADGVPFQYRRTCLVIQDNDILPEEFCKRTTLAVMSGAIATIFSFVAIILHLVYRRNSANDVDQTCGQIEIAVHSLPKGMLEPVSSHAPLKVEFLLSLIPSVLLGLNAIFSTGVQGPASEVGNLYYASFASFFFMVRISMGTLEELTHLDNHDHSASMDAADLSCEGDGCCETIKEDAAETSREYDSQSSFASVDVDIFSRKERNKRLRKFLLLAICSGICSLSALDAADNQDSEPTRLQKYMIFAPAAVSALSTIFFLMCLRPFSYSFAARLSCGGVATVVMFLIWLTNLLVTMHSEDSWAVNSIGEIRNANLYYFSWASIIVAGLQIVSYAEPFVSFHDSKDAMFAVWATNVKVCMVILGAALHVWHSIADTCGENDYSANADDNMDAGMDEEEMQAAEVAGNEAFCSRTKLALGVAVTGILCGWLAMGSRILGCPITKRYRTYVEAFISIILVIVFGAGVAFVTGIGGPGQSVGDLYYASWLAFGVSLGSVIASIDQIQQQEIEAQVAQFHNDGNTDTDGIYIDFQEDR